MPDKYHNARRYFLYADTHGVYRAYRKRPHRGIAIFREVTSYAVARRNAALANKG